MYTKIEARIWQDQDFKKLSDSSKLLFIYLLTCPHRNMVGLYYMPTFYILNDFVDPSQTVSKGFQDGLKMVVDGLSELSENGFIRVDKQSEMIFICNYLKYNPPENPNQVKKMAKVIESLPETVLIFDLYATINMLNIKEKEIVNDVVFEYIRNNGIANVSKVELEPFRNPFETLSKPVTVTVTEDSIQEQYKNIFSSKFENDAKNEKSDELKNETDNCDSVFNSDSNNSKPDDSDFEKFWDMYGLKVDKKKCEAKWKRLKSSDKEKIFESLPAYISSTVLVDTKKDGVFVPRRKNPLTYLNGECWNDDIINNKTQGVKKDGFTTEYYKANESWSKSDKF